jgi:uncharacterized membrane protein YphA (DoxX/SURF4 family)
MQRLFSTFADGWPGAGLLLLRLLTASALIHFGIECVRHAPPPLMVILQVIGIAAGAFLLVGMFTPVAGVLAVTVKLWLAAWRLSSNSGDLWVVLAQGILAAVLAMTGPGAWSIDARRFGRKHIDLSDR